MTIAKEHYVGIDVAMDRCDVAMLGEKATGGYEEALVLALFEAGLPVALVSPQRVRQHARACGVFAKTDKLDAQNLAEYGKNIQPRPFVAKSEDRRKLSALVNRRKQLEEMLYAEKNRLRAFPSEIQDSLETVIHCLKTEVEQLDVQIHHFIRDHEDLKAQEMLLRSAKSIGPVTAATLLADLPELASWTASRSQLWWAWHR
jgi:transposase